MKKLLILCFIFTITFSQNKKLTLEDIFLSTKFMGKSISGMQWQKKENTFTYLQQDTLLKVMNIMKYDCETKKRSIFVEGKNLKLDDATQPMKFSSYQISENQESAIFIALPPERQYLSRLTPAGNLFLYSIKNNSFQQLTNYSEEIYHPKFSFDGKFVGYVFKHNIYSIDLSNSNITQLTFDGTENIINGKFDWVYEEEFGIADGSRWSPDSKQIAFWQLDQSGEPDYTLTEWDSLHLTLKTMKYPKAGDPNAIVKIGVINASTGQTNWVDLGIEKDIYIPRILWKNSNELVVEKMNRLQNKLEFLVYNTNSKIISKLFEEVADKYLDIHDDLKFLKDGSFLWASERDGYRHIYYYGNNGKLIHQITKGQFDVDQFYGIDEDSKIIYFSSSEETPLERKIYSIKINGNNKKVLTQLSGTNRANFSPSFDYFINYFSNNVTPTKISLNKNDGKLVEVLEANEHLPINEYQLALTKYFNFTTTDGVNLNASLMLPEDFDSTKKYPVLVFTYGGPGSQVVTNNWGGARGALWNSYLCQNGYLIFMLDNRGTGARGRDFRQITYGQLGKIEVRDQIEGAKYLSSLSFVDKDRIGIWGWSYGGYMSSYTILEGADYFKLAIAVAPVTNWRFYDSIYTERYMGLPQFNSANYDDTAPVNHAKKLKGKFLLIHGTGDDNVHFQNSVNFVYALQKEAKQFSTMYYPNKNHGIGGGNTSFQLYTLMTNFILTNL
ncbi:MAG: S9 family peptidase [Bacteroidetes bacterium]|nr:S9 family peptidase [Bacteroidota bacterium]